MNCPLGLYVSVTCQSPDVLSEQLVAEFNTGSPNLLLYLSHRRSPKPPISEQLHSSTA